MPDQPEFLTVEEAAAILRIGRTSAYALAREWRETGGRRGLPVIELGRQLRVPRAALEELHATITVPVANPELVLSTVEPDSGEHDSRPRRRRRWGS